MKRPAPARHNVEGLTYVEWLRAAAVEPSAAAHAAFERGEDPTEWRAWAQSFQPRWVQFCRAHQLDLEPDGKNHVFVTWMFDRWNDWRELRGRKPSDPVTGADHRDFNAWLTSYVDALPADKQLALPGVSP